MRVGISLIICYVIISVGVLIVCAEEVSGTDIIILKSADPNSGDENVNLENSADTTTKRVFSAEMGGLCSSAELTRHRHRRHNHRQQSCSCRRILCPVCGNDSQSYANLCFLNCQKLIHPDLDLAYNGRCKSNTAKTAL